MATRAGILPAQDYPLYPPRKTSPKAIEKILYWPSLFGQDGWTLASFFSCEFIDLNFISVHKHTKKELGHYPAILTSHFVDNPYILSNLCKAEKLIQTGDAL